MNGVVHYSQLTILAVRETAKSSFWCPDLQRHYFLSDMVTVYFLDVLFSSQGLFIANFDEIDVNPGYNLPFIFVLLKKRLFTVLERPGILKKP